MQNWKLRISWMISGLKIEFEKLNQLANQTFLTNTILVPTINRLLARDLISKDECDILINGAIKGEFKKADISIKKSSIQVSRILSNLKERDFIHTTTKNGRLYRVNYLNKNFISGIASRLKEQGFLPEGI